MQNFIMACQKVTLVIALLVAVVPPLTAQQPRVSEMPAQALLEEYLTVEESTPRAASSHMGLLQYVSADDERGNALRGLVVSRIQGEDLTARQFSKLLRLLVEVGAGWPETARRTDAHLARIAGGEVSRAMILADMLPRLPRSIQEAATSGLLRHLRGQGDWGAAQTIVGGLWRSAEVGRPALIAAFEADELSVYATTLVESLIGSRRHRFT